MILNFQNLMLISQAFFLHYLSNPDQGDASQISALTITLVVGKGLMLMLIALFTVQYYKSSVNFHKLETKISFALVVEVVSSFTCSHFHNSTNKASYLRKVSELGATVLLLRIALN
jgi:hypothetical protein